MPRTPSIPQNVTNAQNLSGFVPPTRDFALISLPIQVKGGMMQIVVSGPNVGEVLDQLKPILPERELVGIVEKGLLWTGRGK